MGEIGRPLSAGMLDFNPKRMTSDEAVAHGIPSELQNLIADWCQYPLNIASHFPDGVSWFSAEQPWFFRSVLSNEKQTQQLEDSDVLILSGSGMSAYRFQEEPGKHYSPEDKKYLEKSEELVKNHLGEGKWILGICFGGQLGMHAIGGSIGRLPGTVTEAGWLEHELTPQGKQDEIAGQLPQHFFAPHFHNDYVEALPKVGSIVHTDHGDITVTKADILAIRRGYLDKEGLKNGDTEYIMASVVEFNNGARYYQIQPHPEMATAGKANFLVRMNPWLAGENEMGSDYYQKALTTPSNVNYSIVEVIPRFIQKAKEYLEEQRGIQFIEATATREILKYLLE